MNRLLKRSLSLSAIVRKTYLDLPSALYVGSEHKQSVFSPIEPYIDLTKTKEDLIYSVESRGIKVDIQALYDHGVIYKRITDSLKSIVQDIRKINNELDKMNSRSVHGQDRENKKNILETELDKINSHSVHDQDSEIKKSILEKELEKAKLKLNEIKLQFAELEKKFVLPYLHLPNIIHKNTSKCDEDIFSLFDKPKFLFNPKSHLEIGRGELIFKNVSPTSYYLTGNLALIEASLEEFFLYRLKKSGFKAIASTDIVKTVLAEGCGYDLKLRDQQKYLKILEEDCTAYNQVHYLFGNTTLPSYLSLFAKGTVNIKDNRPIRLVANGKKYSKTIESPEPSLFNTCQSSCVSAFILSPKRVPEESLFSEMAMVVTQTYTELGIHFKFIQYAADKLNPHESYAVGICLYSPYNSKYIEVGRISLHNDYISKRLLILQIIGKKKASFFNVLFLEMADITKLIGIILENNQTEDGKYALPQCLHRHMY